MSGEVRTTSVERVLAAVVNVEVGGFVSDALGGPKWLGRLVAGLGMAAAGDPTMPEVIRQVGKVVAAPGAITVAVLREQGVPVIEAAGNAARSGAERVRNVGDAEFTTAEEF